MSAFPTSPAQPAAEPVERSADRSRTAVLALDLGTMTGWALQPADGTIASGTVSFRPSRYDGGGMRYLRFRGWLDSMAANVPGLSAIYFEEVRRHAGTDAALSTVGFSRY